MSMTSDAKQVFDRDFLASRARLIDLAAALDRVDRAGGLADDPRMKQILAALAVLADGKPGRAERIQTLFSLPYRPQWRQEYGLER